MIKIIHNSANKKLRVKIKRGDKIILKEVVPELRYHPYKRKKVGLIGFSPMPVFKKAGFFESIYLGMEQTYSLTYKIIKFIFVRLIGKLFQGEVPKEVGGPVTIARLAGQTIEFGIRWLFLFAAIISVNLAIINLLPFPALDGGHLTFLFIEAIRGKRLDPRKENLFHLVGFAVLMLLMMALFYGDLVRAIPGVGPPLIKK
jgi:regulator of sigma E protease